MGTHLLQTNLVELVSLDLNACSELNRVGPERSWHRGSSTAL